MYTKNAELIYFISIKQLEKLMSGINKSNEARFSFISLCYYLSISDIILHDISKYYLQQIAKRTLLTWIVGSDKSKMSLGFSGGYIGYSYLCYSLFRNENWFWKWKINTDEQYSKKAYQLLLQYEYSKDHRFLDILNGTACIVHYLFQTGYKEENFYKTIYQYFQSQNYTFLIDKNDKLDLGIAHGALGILVALFECEEFLKIPHKYSIQIAEKYNKLFCSESIEFPQTVSVNNHSFKYQLCHRYGWCYGSLETLNVLYTIFKSTHHRLFGYIEQLIIKYSQLGIDTYGLDSSIFCHGYGSTYLIYSYFYKTLHINIPYKFIKLLKEKVLEYCDLNNEYCLQFHDVNVKDYSDNISIIDGSTSPLIALLSTAINGYDYYGKALCVNIGE